MRIPIPAVGIPAAVVLLYLFVPGLRERPWTPLRIAGAVVALISFALLGVARLQLGKSFSVRPRARELVTSGLYSRLRHPIYFFADLMVIGLLFALQLHWLLPIVPVLIVGQSVQSRREAKVLRDSFGPAYVNYCRRTWF